MNFTLINMFNVMPIATNDIKRTFTEVNKEATRYGYIIHPDCCSTLALNWIESEARVNYNATFYAEWEDIISKNRYELLIDQLLHYATTYGTNFNNGNGYIPNGNDPIIIPYEKFKIIMPATEKDIYERCINMLTSGIALNTETINVLIDYITNNNKYKLYGLDINEIKNKEAQAILSKIIGILPKDPFSLFRCIIYTVTNKSMLIKNKSTIELVKKNANNIKLNTLTEEQKISLASIFYRYKPLFLALKYSTNEKINNIKTNKFTKKINDNASVINKIRRLAVKYHKPFTSGYWETFLTKETDINLLKERLSKNKISNFKIVTLMQSILSKLQNATGKVYVIRNGKVWVDAKVLPIKQSMRTYLMNVYMILEETLVNNIRNKACFVHYPNNINLTIPTSEKNFIGNYPFGTSVTMSDDHNIIGIYWRNEWGTHDFDLHLSDLTGNNYGWNAQYKDTENTIIFSGDMTNAQPEATELFYIKNNVPDAKVTVNQFNGDDISKFKLFVAREDYTKRKYDVLGTKMCNPNDIVAEFIIPLNREPCKECALICDNKIYLMDLSSGQNRIPNTKYSAIYIEQLKNKCRTFIDLKTILEKAGFIFVDSNSELPENSVILDLENINKDTLINIFNKG